MEPFVTEMLGMFPKVIQTALPEDLPQSQATKKNGGMVCYKVRKDFIQFAVAMPAIEHEIAHMVEMKDFSRLVKDDWGFSNHINLSAKSFFAAMAREARVRGISFHLDKNKKFSGFTNSFWFDEAERHFPFGKFKFRKEVYEWAQALCLSAFRAWDLDRIMYEWVKRVDYIRNWQES